MSVKKFKFVSPGIFVNEIDNSFIPSAPENMGPVIIGRTRTGPALRPVKIHSFSEFVQVFGNPIAGAGGGDVWRDGNTVGPTYASYAAQAYLNSGVGPVTMMRLLGDQHDSYSTGGKAGWTTENALGATTTGGAYGLFVFNSASMAPASGKVATGSLAAVWYMNDAKIVLSGTIRESNTETSGTAALMHDMGSNLTFRAKITSGSTTVKETTFNFDRSSDLYIRKVFNTNPQAVNAQHTETVTPYWLGQTFDQNLDRVYGASQSSGSYYAMIAGVASGSYGYHNMQMGFQISKTGWFVSQDTSTDTANYKPKSMQKLFRLNSLDAGEHTQNSFKVSIEDIRLAGNPDIDPYGTFSVVLRNLKDTDNAVEVVERYSNLSLNPNSPNYIARRIGDAYTTWSDSESRFRHYGNHPNQSKYIYVEMNMDVDEGTTDPEYIPAGALGHPRPTGFKIFSGSSGDVGAFDSILRPGDGGESMGHSMIAGYGSIPGNLATAEGGTGSFAVRSAAGSDGRYFTGSVEFPRLLLRNSASDGGMSDVTNAYFGVLTTRGATSTVYDESVPDMLRALPADISAASWDPNDTSTEYSFQFSLDDVKIDTATGIGYWYSGSRAAGTSLSAVSSSFGEILDKGYNKFTTVFAGGFDGLDVTEKEPFRNTKLDDNTELANYAYHTVKRALDTCADPEYVEYNLLTMPGITNTGLTDHAMKICEQRGDALAIVDLDSGYVPFTENTSTVANRRGSVSSVISSLKSRRLNTSYGCAYYPWVQIRDTIDGDTLWAPPSVVALGTMANSHRKAELWFAPAGFNRGGLTDGAGGIPVTNVRERLSAKDRDDLYTYNVNPIASFPAEGIVIFGQKTLQASRSSLDRINVRRLMIYLKKEVSRKAAQVLFDQNVQATWDRFKALVEPLLSSVKTRFGLTEYRLILDESTTTPDLIDQNVMYAKILLKPARAIEYIAVDFVIAPTGASFDD